MLDHLLAQAPQPTDEALQSFLPLEQATAEEILDAKITTDEWLKSLGAEDPTPIDPAYEHAMAAQAFRTVIAPSMTPDQKKSAVTGVKTPASVRKMVEMLTAYEWEFVEQAKEIRAYIVSGLLEETKNPKPDVRLKAYKMLGEVTEVALFTQRTEIVNSSLSDQEIEAKIKERLERLTVDMPLVERVPDLEVDDGG